MVDVTIKVDGMHCPSCEMLIEEDVADIACVEEVKADHKEGTVKIKFEGYCDFDNFRKTIEDLGYKVKIDDS